MEFKDNLIPAGATVVWAGACWPNQMDDLIRSYERYAREQAGLRLGISHGPLHVTYEVLPGDPVYFWWWVD